MLHKETVEKGTLALIKKLSGDEKLKDFVLVGGTALALQIGHRKSVDIDLFSKQAFDKNAIAEHLMANMQLIRSMSKGAITPFMLISIMLERH